MLEPLLLEELFGPLKSDDAGSAAGEGILLARHKIGAAVWAQGITKRTGWVQSGVADRRRVISISQSFAKKHAPDDLESRAVRELVRTYHKLGVWEEPNLGVILPIIDHYTANTRFDGKTLVNPLSLAEGSLHFFFFRSDPEGRLAWFLDSSFYLASANLVLCALPFLESLAKYMSFPEAEPTHFAERIVRSTGEEMDFQALGPEIRRFLDFEFNRFLVEWAIAHEIGHGHLGHRSSLLSKHRFSRVEEEAADDFFVEHIADADRAAHIWLALSNVLAKAYHECYQMESGHPYDGSGMVTLEAPIHLKDASHSHAPFVIRLLDLADGILRRFPDIDMSGYFDKVRRNITLQEVS
jgi:hypothetical protein